MDRRDAVPVWRSSSRSSNTACVEVARQGDKVLVRDSKNPAGPVLEFDRDAFAAFIDGVMRGEFDREPLRDLK